MRFQTIHIQVRHAGFGVVAILSAAALAGSWPTKAEAATCAFAGADTWSLGASGLWGVGGNWSSGAFPNSPGVSACIVDGASTVNLNLNATAGDLALAHGNTLNDAGYTLTLAGPKVVNSGSIQLVAGMGRSAVLNLSNDVSFTGSVLSTGVVFSNITLSTTGGGGTAYIRGAGHTLTNVDNVIQGAGVIGDDGMNLANGTPGTIGEINANTPGGELDIGSGGGSFKNYFAVLVGANSTLKVTADAKGFDQLGGFTTVDGTLIVPHGFNNEATSHGVFNGKGVLEGTGVVIGDVFNDGYIQPGSETSTSTLLTIDGALTQGSLADYTVSAGGTDVGQYSHLNVTGLATLGGVLDVHIGFPLAGPKPTTFDIMNFGSSTGDFTGVSYNYSPCTSVGADLWSCAPGFYLQEMFVGGNQLDLVARGVPEPRVWAMMLFGLAAVGAALRAGRRSGRALVAA